MFVRKDLQEGPGEVRQLDSAQPKGPTPPSKWKCANEENASHLSEDRRKTILQMIRARDQARFRQNYQASDKMRDELKAEYGVHVDDRLKMWWTAVDADNMNAVPDSIRDIKGEGRWGDRTTEWRQIPTTPENDASVDPDLVEGLLKQRDVARREKDWAVADRLLEQARTAPDGDLCLRIHDESRTWRIWTNEPPPPRAAQRRGEGPATLWNDDGEDKTAASSSLSPAQQCIEIVKEHDPAKLDEIHTLLEKFPGREYNILKKIKQRYL